MNRRAIAVVTAASLASTLTLAAPALAQTPPAYAPASVSTSGVAEARAVVRALGGVAGLRDGLQGALEASIQADPADQRLDPERRARLRAALDAEIAARRDAIETELAGLYARNYSYDELRDLHAFLETPAGRAFAQRQGAVIGQSVEWGQRFAREVLSPAIEARMAAGR